MNSRSAKIEIAILQPHVFGDVDTIFDGKRGCFGLVQNCEFRSFDIDFTGRHRSVRPSFRTGNHFPTDGENEFRAEGLRKFIRLALFRLKGDLRDTVAIPKVHKNESAEIATLVDPAGQGHLLPDVGSPEFTTSVCSLLVLLHVRCPLKVRGRAKTKMREAPKPAGILASSMEVFS